MVPIQFPIALCERRTITVGRRDILHGTGQINEQFGHIEVNVTKSGSAELYWFLDREGKFFKLRSAGTLPPTLMQRLGLQRTRERYVIEPGQAVTARKLRSYLASLDDEYPEAPHVPDLRKRLLKLADDAVVTRDFLQDYFGE
jgi:hypothetical protein